ncbi:Aftiphilin [Oryzias melastigma]|uniref:Aftiphilin n=1 Tax=Oryzias melastigma TaxID=30732 RepID=A0A834C357_ORYME|nr:Aftiphilin [Oryzias melastigma]
MALPPSSSTFDEESEEFCGCGDANGAPSQFQTGSFYCEAGLRPPAPRAALLLRGRRGLLTLAVFGEQAAHPWCCGLTERWDSQVGGANQPVGNSGREGVTESAPRSQHAPGAKEDGGCPAADRQPQDRSRPRDDGEAQETSATSRRAESGTEGPHATERNTEQRILGNIPLSDSFADFCSAPTQGGGGGAWAHFEERFSLTEQKEVSEVSSLQPEEEEPGAARRSSTQTACRVLQLLRSSFPEVLLHAEEEEELLDLSAVLQAQRPPQSEDDPSHTHRTEPTMLWPHHHIHSSVGLQFRWDGSHSNQILLRCLGVDSRNIVFRKKPLSLSAAGQRPPDPSKDAPAGSSADPLKACCVQEPSEFSLQELPSSPLDWSIRGLSSSQDAASPRRAPLFWGWK